LNCITKGIHLGGLGERFTALWGERLHLQALPFRQAEFSGPSKQARIKPRPISVPASGIFVANVQGRKEFSMKLGAYAAALGSIEQQKRLDVIANNIANANSPGFKKDNVHFSNFLGEVTYTSMEQGPVRETGHKLDVALSGNGFLKVQTDQGTYYTRAGDLTLNSSKILVTQDGWPVLGKRGPIKIEYPASLQIEENGQVIDGGNQVDKLDIVQFPSDAALKKTQNGYFEPAATGTVPVQAQNCTVRQGALEGANFNPVEEMVKMVETTRNFEAYQKTMQTFDRDLDGQIISKLTT
jgi:flagellar basal-body rod protein FlgF